MEQNSVNTETIATQSSSKDPNEVYSPELIAHNQRVVNSSRVWTSLVAGCAAGILGITGILPGFLFYAVITAFTSLLLAIRAQFNFKKYFYDKNGPMFEGLFSGAMTYLLFWTLMYDITHVYT